jgi:hypothetical protein
MSHLTEGQTEINLISDNARAAIKKKKEATETRKREGRIRHRDETTKSKDRTRSSRVDEIEAMIPPTRSLHHRNLCRWESMTYGSSRGISKLRTASLAPPKRDNSDESNDCFDWVINNFREGRKLLYLAKFFGYTLVWWPIFWSPTMSVYAPLLSTPRVQQPVLNFLLWWLKDGLQTAKGECGWFSGW